MYQVAKTAGGKGLCGDACVNSEKCLLNANISNYDGGKKAARCVNMLNLREFGSEVTGNPHEMNLHARIEQPNNQQLFSHSSAL
jgi:hypothetical protein